MITTAQIRGARGILNWSQGDLSDRTDISATSIGSIENGLTQPRESTLAIIQKSFEDAGIEFLPNDGIRKRIGEVRVLTGRAGFQEFYDIIYQELLKSPSEVLVSDVDERLFEKWHGAENVKSHIERMKSVSGVSYKILLREGDKYITNTGKDVEYRWIPKDQFSSVPFYVFGDKLAIIIFDNEPTVILMDYSIVSKAYAIQFNALWDRSKTIKENK